MSFEEPGPFEDILLENVSRLAKARASANQLDGTPSASSHHQGTTSGSRTVTGSTLSSQEVSEELNRAIRAIRGIDPGNFETEVEASDRAKNSSFQKWWNRLVAKPAKVLGNSFFISLIPGFGPAICLFLSHQQIYTNLKDLKIGRVAQSALRERIIKDMVIDLVVRLMFPVVGSVYRRLLQKNHAHVSHATRLVEDHARLCEVLFIRHLNICSLQSQALPTASSTPVPGWTRGYYATPSPLSLPPAAISGDFAEVDESHEDATPLEGASAASRVRSEYLQREARRMQIHKRDDLASNIVSTSYYSISSGMAGLPADTSAMLLLPSSEIQAIIQESESGSNISPIPQPHQVEDFSISPPAIRPRLVRTHAFHGDLPTLSNIYAIPVAHHVSHYDAAYSMAPQEPPHGGALTPLRPASMHLHRTIQGDDLPGPITITSFIENSGSYCYDSDAQDDSYDESDDSAREALEVVVSRLLQELKDYCDDEDDSNYLVDSDYEDHEPQGLSTEPPLDHHIHLNLVEGDRGSPEVSATSEEGYSTASPSMIVESSLLSIHYSVGSAGTASSPSLTISWEDHHPPIYSSLSPSFSPSHTMSPHPTLLPPLLPLGIVDSRQIQPPKRLVELCVSRWQSQHVRAVSPTLIVATGAYTNPIVHCPTTCTPCPVCSLKYLSQEHQPAHPSEVARRIRRDSLSNDEPGSNCALFWPDYVGHETQGEGSTLGEATTESAIPNELKCILRPLDHRWRIEDPSVLTRIMDEEQSFTGPADDISSLSTWHSTMESDDDIHPHLQPQVHLVENYTEQEDLQSLEDISSYLQPRFDVDSDEQPRLRQPLEELEAAVNNPGKVKASFRDKDGEGDEDQRDGRDEYRDNGWNGDCGNVSVVDDMMSDNNDIEASFSLLRTYQTRPTLQDRLVYEMNKRAVLREWRHENDGCV